MRPRAALGGLVVTLLTIAAGIGCGGEEQAIRDAFSELRRAYLTEDYRAACAGMTAAARREVGELGHEKPTVCPRDLAQNMSAAILSPRDRVEPEIERVDVTGDEATVTARLGGTTTGVVHFAKEDGEWKLAQLFGTTAPPPPDLQ
jgi:hypothetical protein